MANGFTLQDIIDQENRYIDDLIGQAAGDRDFIIKRLEAEHSVALGTDDRARAEFLERVADKLEERIGTIAFDFERATGRTEEDVARALSRLDEDEALARKELGFQTEEEQAVKDIELQQRGITFRKRGEEIGLAGQEREELERKQTERLEALDRALGRQRSDIELGRKRDIEDITTGARRQALGAQRGFEFGKEGAQRGFEAQKKELERQRKSIQPTALAGFTNLLGFGGGGPKGKKKGNKRGKWSR